MLDIKSFLQNLTTHPGVYQMIGENGDVIYVGKALNLKKRVSSYFKANQQDPKTRVLVKNIKDIVITVTRNENEALLLECNLIKKHRPRYNVLFRDDKTYPYILITNDAYPRIDFYRGSRKKDGLYFGPYPNSTAVRETIHLIQKLFGIRTCTDNFFATRTRPCLHHQIGLCSGSCAGLVPEETYREDVNHAILFLKGKSDEIVKELTRKMEQASRDLQYELAATLRDQIAKLREIQERQYISGGHKQADIIGIAASAGIVCIQLLTIRDGRMLGSRTYFPTVPADSSSEEVLTSFITQHYLNPENPELEIPKEILTSVTVTEHNWLANVLTEQSKHKVIVSCPARGERKKWVEMADKSAKESLASQLLNKANTHERFKALQELLKFPQPPHRIECFDISHTMGEATVASCVVFNINGPIKSDYRRFNITDITPGDDPAAMKQALTRRFKKQTLESRESPDILLIDGGIPQINATRQVLAELNIHNILVIGVAKGPSRKPGLETLHIVGETPIHLAPDSLALHLIQQVRDEAHRFAITGHRMRRDKTRRTSTLESIPGIGAKRRRELLRYFGGIQAINRASLDELAKVPGISRALAERIFESLHEAAG